MRVSSKEKNHTTDARHTFTCCNWKIIRNEETLSQQPIVMQASSIGQTSINISGCTSLKKIEKFQSTSNLFSINTLLWLSNHMCFQYIYFPQPLDKFSGLAQYVLLMTMIIMKEIHSLLYHLIGMCTKIKQQIICNRKKTLI